MKTTQRIGVLCGAAIALAIIALIGYIVFVLSAVDPMEIAGVLSATVVVLAVIPRIVRALRGDRR